VVRGKEVRPFYGVRNPQEPPGAQKLKKLAHLRIVAMPDHA